jgi:YVTN family beta-propeller protein
LEKGNKTPEVTPSPTQSLEKGNKTPEVTPSPTQSLEKGNKTPEVTPSPTQSLEKGNKTPEVTPSPSLGLEKGNRSSEVSSLQKKLQAAGYFDGPVTGYYGSLTQEAVSKFQQAKGLTTNGIADEATLKALDSGSGASAPPKPAAPQKVVTDDPNKVSRPSSVELERGSKGSQVTSLQKKLQAAGYFDGPVTGYYGPLTQEAVTKFQQAKGLTAHGVADEETLKALESGSGASAPPKKAAPQEVVTDSSKVENQGNLGNPQKATPPAQNTPQKVTPPAQNTPQKATPPVQNTPQKATPSVQNTPQKATPPVQNTPQAASPSLQSEMKLKKTIYGKISPKSVVHSGTGLFFAQNMMYSHTITVYDRKYNLVKTIPDTVNLTKYGYSKLKGKYQGAPVETAFSHNGKYAWVSNYQMYGPEFNNPGSDECSPSQGTDNSFLYRINTESLGVEKVIQVGSVPKYVAASPDNRLVLVSNWCSWDLSVVDTEKNKEIKRIELGRYPRGIVVDSNSEKAYIAVMGSYDIARIDLKDFSLGWLSGIGQSPRHLNIDPADKYLYATLNGEGTVAKIDLSKGKVLDKVVTGNAPRSMVISDDGQVLYVVNYNSNTVSKVRTSDMKVLQTVDVNDAPIGITYDPQTREIWVACYSGSIMVFQD